MPKKFVENEFPEVKTIRELIEYGKNKGKNKNCLFKGKDNDEPLSFNCVYDLVKDLGTYLLSINNKKSNLAIIGENSTEWILSCLSIMCSGNVAIPLDRDLSDEELLAMISKCECTTIFYSDKCCDLIDKLAKTSNKIKTINLKDVYDLADEGRKLIENGNCIYDVQIPQPDDLASIIFTSGTSGDKKGVMLTQRNLASDALYACKNVNASNTLILLPLHHSFIWSAAMLPMFLYVVEAHVSSNMRRIVKDLQRFKPQNISAVPMMVEMLYSSIWNTARKNNQSGKLRNGLMLSRILMKLGIDKRREIFADIHNQFGGNLELIICGGAALDPEIQKGLYDLGIDVVCGYGITECSPIVAVEHNNEHRYGSVGKPLGCNEVRIADEDDKGIGEILVKGANVMKGYYKDQESTNESFDGEWFKTGDFGRIDKNGFLFVTGRKKNLIVLSNGENVSPEELEQKLMRIPYVKEVAVYESDRMITAEFYLDETVEDAEIRLKEDVNKFNKTIPTYKNIARYKVRDIPFEKTTTMKIKKYLLNSDKGKK